MADDFLDYVAWWQRGRIIDGQRRQAELLQDQLELSCLPEQERAAALHARQAARAREEAARGKRAGIIIFIALLLLAGLLNAANQPAPLPVPPLPVPPIPPALSRPVPAPAAARLPLQLPPLPLPPHS